MLKKMIKDMSFLVFGGAPYVIRKLEKRIHFNYVYLENYRKLFIENY